MAEEFGIDSFHQLPVDPQLGIPKAVYARRADNSRPAWKALLETAKELVQIVEGDEAKGIPGLNSAAASVPELLFDNAKTPAEIAFADGNSTRLSMPARELRMLCRSASMWDEFTGEKLFKEEDIPSDVRPKQIDTAGRYAVRVIWTDGHQSLFAHKYLRKVFQEHGAT